MSLARQRDLAMVGLGLLVIVLDQVTKHWIVSFFSTKPLGYSVPILGPIVTLEYVQNTGVAFSLLQGQVVMFLFIALAIGVIGYLYWRSRETGSLALKLSFGLVLGGALGNLIDRFSHAYVVDFIHFQIPHIFDFAVFNVADSAISIGVVLLAIMIWRMGTEGERHTSHTSGRSISAGDTAETPAED
jgi:signal peptidase II